jgi:hypothetical protein
MWGEVFGYGLATLAFFTSAGMLVLGRGWQKFEAAAYGGTRRPLWFWLAVGLLGLVWALAAWDFAKADRNWAGWVLIAGAPLVWSLKATLIVFNPKGRQAVTKIDTDAGWRRIGLARLPIALVVALLTAFA